MWPATNDYLAARPAPPLVETIAEADLLREIEVDGVRALFNRVQALLRLGDVDAVDRLLRISKPLIVDVTKAARATIAKRLGANALPDAAEREQDAAWKLMTIIEDRRRAKFPPEIGIAVALRDRVLQPAFTAIVGVNAWRMDDASFRAILDGQARVPERWQIDPRWAERELDAPRWTPAGTGVTVR